MRIGSLTRAALLLLAGIVAGAGLALALRGGSAQNDPCFGHGDLISSRNYTISSDGAANAREIGVRAVAGERLEARECRASPLEVFTVDASSGLVLSSELSFADALAYYAQHPDEAPAARAERSAKRAFVTVNASAVRPLLEGSGCAPSWKRLDIPSRQLRACYPAGWTVDASVEARVLLTKHKVTLNFHSPSASASLECDSPTTFETLRGPVRVCAMSPLEGGQSHHLLMPGGIVAFLWVSYDATPAQRAAAFRVAMSAEALP